MSIGPFYLFRTHFESFAERARKEFKSELKSWGATWRNTSALETAVKSNLKARSNLAHLGRQQEEQLDGTPLKFQSKDRAQYLQIYLFTSNVNDQAAWTWEEDNDDAHLVEQGDVIRGHCPI